jgi:hypothetical protein
MVALAEILIAEANDNDPCGHCGDETRVPTRTARCRVCSPVHFLLSAFCWRSRPTRDHRRTQPLANNLYQGMALDAVTERR